MQDKFEILNRTFSRFYNPAESLAIDEVIVLFKERVIFRHYIPKKHKHFGIIMYKLCDSNGYTNDIKVYLEKDKQCMSQNFTATPATVTELTRKIEGHGQKLYMDNLFSLSELFYEVTKNSIIVELSG